MKLFELINTQTKTTNNKSEFELDKMMAFRDENTADPKSGAYAYGSVNKKDPHMFNKKTYMPTDLDNDGYYQYVKAIEKHIGSNPYFPRIYVIELKKDPKGKIIPNYDIEALSNGDDFSFESLLSLAKRMYKDFPTMTEEHDGGILGLRRKMAEYMRDSVRANDFSAIRDNNLKGALMLVAKIIKSNENFMCDLHKDNIMFRGTPNGPQLVITDPIS
jgi:hypothetical protein